MTRKNLNFHVGILLSLICLPAFVWGQSEPTFSIKKAGNDVVLLQIPNLYNLNLITIDCGDFLTIVDTLSSVKEARAARAKLTEIYNKPVKYIINTHQHWDHTFGNQVFPEAEIIAHEYCKEDMLADYSDKTELIEALQAAADALASQGQNTEDDQHRQRERGYYLNVIEGFKSKDFRLTLPTKLVGDRTELKLGNKTFRLYNIPGLHTRSNLLIHVVEAGIFIQRPQFIEGTIPVFEKGIELDKLIKASEEINNSQLSWLVPGHGDPVSAEELSLHLDYLKALKNAVAKAGSLEEVSQHFPLDQFPHAKRLIRRHNANIEFCWDSRQQ